MNKNRERNAEFVGMFDCFGMKDSEIFDKLMQRGKIASILSKGDLLTVSYESDRFNEAVVERSEVKDIDPKTGKVIGSKFYFKLNPKRDKVPAVGVGHRNKKPSLGQHEGDSNDW